MPVDILSEQLRVAKIVKVVRQKEGVLIALSNEYEKHRDKYIYLLKTELQISDFQHFNWLDGHRLSVYIYLLYQIWSRNASAKKQAENIFAALRKNGRQKPFWTGID